MNNTLELGLSQNVGSALMPEVINGKVDARSVHESLEVASAFTVWMQRRVQEFGFVEGEDYFPNLESKTLGQGGHNRLDFLLTLDMAKELAMVERNEMGRKMRRYFIECEKQLTTPAVKITPAGLNKLETALVDLAREHDGRIAKLESQLLPGSDWLSPSDWLTQHGYPQQNPGRLSKLSAIATQRSAAKGYPIATQRGPHGYRRAFSPSIIAEFAPRILSRWMEKDAQKGGRP